MFFKTRLISKVDEIRLIKAIQLAELKTSGEVRVHIVKHCKTDAINECKIAFEKLKMFETSERNGILFYLAISSKQFAVWGDEGIHQKVHQQFWDDITKEAIGLFKQDKLIEGLESAIHHCGEQLQHHFPYNSTTDKNELSNNISY